MSARVIAVVNQKGGAGKTTTAQMTAAALAKFHGAKVLTLDADAQASLTIAAGKDDLEGLQLSDVLEGADASQAIITGVGSGYDLIPGGEAMALLERKLNRRDALKEAIEPIKSGYDYILIDCPPSLSVVTLNCVMAADETVIPAIPHYLHIAGVEKVLDTIEELNRNGAKVKRSRVLFTQADANTNLARETMESTRSGYGDVFNTVIRRNITLAEAQSAGYDIFEYRPSSNGAKDYRALADEINE